jgi:hypothetical protein
MPTKKQRRRRAKELRHEYDFVLLDEDGNEVPLDPEERLAEREQKAAAKPKSGRGTQTGRARGMREPPQPTWERALRRGGLMGGLMLVAFIFVFKNGPIGSRVAIGLVYGVAFVPLTYFVDRTAYRAYLRRLERAKAKKA